MEIKVEVEFKDEVALGWANGWGDLQNALFAALSAKAKELGIKCRESKLSRCCHEYRYPGLFNYRVDSSD